MRNLYSPEGLQKGQKGAVCHFSSKVIKKGAALPKSNFVYTKGLFMSKP